MLVGAFYFPTDYGIAIGELARALEERGFDSLFVCEHTHIPVSRRSPYPGGGELPRRYSHTHDPFVALSFAAAATRTLKLGTGIALIPQRDPIITAKAVARCAMRCCAKNRRSPSDNMGRPRLPLLRWAERRPRDTIGRRPEMRKSVTAITAQRESM